MIVAGACAGGVLLAPGVASAHIEPDPAAVEAGSAATVGFTVEHGCEGSPTVGLRFQVPEGVTDAAPVDKPGWTGSVDGRVVSFTGGPLDGATSDSFEISFTAPAEAQTLYFPVVQSCEVGETAWIAIPAEGSAASEDPAPAILVTAGPPTADELAPAEDDDEGGEGGEHEGHRESESPEASAVGESSDDGDGGVSGGLIAAGIGAVVIVVGAGVVVSRRRRDTTG